MYLVSEVTNRETQVSRRCLRNVGSELPERVERMRRETGGNRAAIGAPAARRRGTEAAESPDVQFDTRFAWGDVP